MQKAVISGERRAEVHEVPTPRAKLDWALVKVLVAPMCTEYKAFVAGSLTQHLGHEAAGEVVEVAQPGPVSAGDRVVVMPLCSCGVCQMCVTGEYIYCRQMPRYADLHGSLEGSATYSQYLLKQHRLLCKVPDDVSIERASLACCALGPSFGAFQRAGLSAGDTVLITGAGPVGLGAALNAQFRNSRTLVVEGNPYRAQLASGLGVEVVLDPADPELLAQVRGLTGGRGVDLALDCSGVPAAQRTCIDAARRRGQVALIGECWDRTLEITVSNDMIRKGLTVFGSWHYSLADFPGVLDVIRRSPLVDKLVTHKFGMSRVQEALEVSASQQCGKILLNPWE